MGSPLVPNSNISFLGMRNKWSEVDFSGGSDPGTTDIKISEFRGATFTDGTTVPTGSTEELSINDDFKGKTFGSSSSSPEFEWYYYAYGSNTGTIYIYWYDNSTGNLSLLRSITGQQHTGSTQSWDQYTEDLLSYAGQTGRIVIAYKTGSSFRQDIQLDDMELKETTSGTIDLDPGTSTGRGNWQRKTSYTTNLSYPISGSWSPISISTSSSNRWNYDRGGTPSGSTGGTRDVAGSTSGYYLYFEGSSPNFSSSTRYYWLRTGEYTLSGGDGGEGGGGDGPSPK